MLWRAGFAILVGRLATGEVYSVPLHDLEGETTLKEAGEEELVIEWVKDAADAGDEIKSAEE